MTGGHFLDGLRGRLTYREPEETPEDRETAVLQDFLHYLKDRVKAPNHIGSGTIQALQAEAERFVHRRENG